MEAPGRILMPKSNNTNIVFLLASHGYFMLIFSMTTLYFTSDYNIILCSKHMLILGPRMGHLSKGRITPLHRKADTIYIKISLNEFGEEVNCLVVQQEAQGP